MDNKRPASKVTIMKDGPYLVSGQLPLIKEIIVADEEKTPIQWAKGEEFPINEKYSLCRCGQSKNMPYCDGTHQHIHFDGTETATTEKYFETAEKNVGPDLILMDNEKLCAVALFCHRAGDAWTLTEHSDDPWAKATAIQETFDCPSGRLVACDKNTNKPLEPYFEPTISLIEDPVHQVSGPIWVKGGIPIESSNGTVYEVRNRVTLCRCGKSKNKPFCDGTHIEAGFTDGDPSLKK